jgi:RNA polymerase sigma factor (sigma-70 family)
MELHKIYKNYIFRIFINFKIDYYDVEDLSADFWLQISLLPGDYITGQSPKPLLAKIAKNMAIDYLRKKKHFRKVDLDTCYDNQPSTDLYNNDYQHLMQDLSKHLSDIELDIVENHVFKKTTLIAYADFRKMNVNTIRQHYSTARRKLRKLEEFCE